jgi:N2,N2-dimethylguanosine tRNA methyltransferase
MFSRMIFLPQQSRLLNGMSKQMVSVCIMKAILNQRESFPRVPTLRTREERCKLRKEMPGRFTFLYWISSYTEGGSDLMYSHRPEGKHVDCIDLDPYGTAAPFIDAAVQAIADGGARFSNLLVLETRNCRCPLCYLYGSCCSSNQQFPREMVCITCISPRND